MQSVLLLLPPQKTVRGAFTWKIWAAVQEITGRSGQTVAGSGRLALSAAGTVSRTLMICVARQYSPKYTIQNRKAIRRARFHLGMLNWGWIGSV
jgi:hypothetical protein